MQRKKRRLSQRGVGRHQTSLSGRDSTHLFMAMLHSMLTSSLPLLSRRSPSTHSVVSTLRVVSSSTTGGAKTTPATGKRKEGERRTTAAQCPVARRRQLGGVLRASRFSSSFHVHESPPSNMYAKEQFSSRNYVFGAAETGHPAPLPHCTSFLY